MADVSERACGLHHQVSRRRCGLGCLADHEDPRTARIGQAEPQVLKECCSHTSDWIASRALVGEVSQPRCTTVSDVPAHECAVSAAGQARVEGDQVETRRAPGAVGRAAGRPARAPDPTPALHPGNASRACGQLGEGDRVRGAPPRYRCGDRERCAAPHGGLPPPGPPTRHHGRLRALPARPGCRRQRAIGPDGPAPQAPDGRVHRSTSQRGSRRQARAHTQSARGRPRAATRPRA
jgi:hypothetical protein